MVSVRQKPQAANQELRVPVLSGDSCARHNITGTKRAVQRSNSSFHRLHRIHYLRVPGQCRVHSPKGDWRTDCLDSGRIAVFPATATAAPGNNGRRSAACAKRRGRTRGWARHPADGRYEHRASSRSGRGAWYRYRSMAMVGNRIRPCRRPGT